jgi:probable F420-dependent oxidoreductase
MTPARPQTLGGASLAYGVVMELGKLGVWTSYGRIGEENAAEAARLAEGLGYGTFWLGSSPRLSGLRPLLEGSERMVVATGIANVWAYDPADLAREYAELERDFPGRVLVGIGIGHPEATSDYSRPLTAMRSFLDVLDRPESQIPKERRILAALAPKMLELSAERALGAAPYFVPVAHTRYARERVGSGSLLAPELAFALGGRAPAREYAALYLSLGNYTSNLLRHGFGEEDLADGGSDRLIDEVVPNGDVGRIAAIARAHFDAGADHVVLQAVGEQGIPRAGWTALAEALVEEPR